MDYLIVNATAGNAHDTDYWLRLLQRAGVEAQPCEGADAQSLPPLGRGDRLLVAGGDGTVRRFAPWCAERGCVLCVLPAGTANDFARGLGIPLEAEAACVTLKQGHVQEVDLGWMEREVILNVAHAGLGSEISPNIDPEIKRRWGRLSYLRTLLDRLGNPRGFRARISCGGFVKHGRWLEIAVANGGSFGSGQRIFEASPKDGELNVVAIKPRSWYLLFGVWLMAWLRGATPQHDAIVQLHGHECRITDCRKRAVTADGESVGELPARFHVDAGALRVIVPAPKST